MSHTISMLFSDDDVDYAPEDNTCEVQMNTVTEAPIPSDVPK